MGNHFLQVWDHMDSLVAHLVPFFYHIWKISRKYHSFRESQVSCLSPSPLLQVLPLPKFQFAAAERLHDAGGKRVLSQAIIRGVCRARLEWRGLIHFTCSRR